MPRVLVLTGLLPINLIKHKVTENDILLVTEDEIVKRYPAVVFSYIFIFPFANKLLANFSEKWKSYYKLKKKDTFLLRNRLIYLLPVFLLPKKLFIRTVLIRVTLFLYKKRIKKIIKTFKPTVIHAQNTDVTTYLARCIGEKYNIPYIVTLRGINLHVDSVVKKNIEKASSLIAISPTQKKDVNSISSKKVNFIPHGISDVFFKKERAEILPLPLRLVTVCRLIPLKNIDLILHALNDYKGEVVFDIYGDGSEKNNLKDLINKLNLKSKVNLKGFVANEKLPSLLQSYHVFIMPSFPETLGRVYFEAMACGLPVIASKNTGIDGLITEKEEGFLLDVNNEDEFKKKLILILDELQANPVMINSMSIKAKKYATQYTWDAIAPKYISLYKKASK